MTLVVGCAADQRGKAVFQLAAMLARSAGEDLQVVSVIPAPWFPGMAKIDAEYQEYLHQQADDSLEHARQCLPDDVPATFVRHEGRSTPARLVEVAQQAGARMIVLGSSSAGVFGHIALGSVTDRLLHSSPIALALAPRGFRTSGPATVVRVTAAYGGSEQADDLVVAAAGVAARVGASVRLAMFAVRPRTPITAGVGSRAESAVAHEWEQEVRRYAEEALERVRALPDAPELTGSVVGRGRTWAEAMEDVEWADGDVLVVGSSAVGPVARVFLGSRASKIVRHSPVPVVVVPGGRIEELAEEAERP